MDAHTHIYSWSMYNINQLNFQYRKIPNSVQCVLFHTIRCLAGRVHIHLPPTRYTHTYIHTYWWSETKDTGVAQPQHVFGKMPSARPVQNIKM